jgi:hypothetical protein
VAFGQWVLQVGYIAQWVLQIDYIVQTKASGYELQATLVCLSIPKPRGYPIPRSRGWKIPGNLQKHHPCLQRYDAPLYCYGHGCDLCLPVRDQARAVWWQGKVHWCDCCPKRSEETLKEHAGVELHGHIQICKEISKIILSWRDHQERQAKSGSESLNPSEQL